MYKRKFRTRLMAIIFALIAVGIFIILISFIAYVNVPRLAKNHCSQENVFFSKVKFKAYDNKENEIHLTSDNIYEIEKNYIFQNMIFTFPLPNGGIGTISANTTKAIGKDMTKCEFNGNVRLITESGLSMKTEKSLVDFEKKIATGDMGVIISKGEAEVSSKRYTINMDENIVILIDEAKGALKADKITSNKLVVCFSCEEDNSSIKKLEAIGNAVYISKNYILKAKKNILYFSDKVEANDNVILLYNDGKSDYDIRSNFMNARIDNRGAIDCIKANGSLIIKTKNVTINADKGVLENNIIKVFDNVTIFGDQGCVLGNEATLNTETGDVFVNKSSGIVNNWAHK